MPRHSSRNAVLTAIVFVFVIAAAAFYAATRLGLIHVTGPSDAAPHAAGSALRPAGTLAAALALASGWVNGTPDSASVAPTLIVIWNDAHPDGIAALARAGEIADAYQHYGVRVIGIHEPDFAFAADTAVTGRTARRLGAHFPIALDPAGHMAAKLGVTELRAASVLANSKGAVYSMHRGARGVDQNEMVMRKMIEALDPAARFPADGEHSLAEQYPGRIETIYLGVGRATEGPITTTPAGRAVPFTAQFRFEVEGKPLVPYPVGWWKPESDGLIAARGGAATFVALRYEGGALDAVLSPPAGTNARVWILSDEHWLTRESRGEDVRLDPHGLSYLDVTEPRLYRLARGRGSHVVKLSPDAPGVTFHALVVEPEE